MADPFQTAPQITPDQIIDMLLRGKWIIIIPLCITLTLGLAKTLTADKTYQASTLILVQPQRVPTNYVRSVVTSTIGQRISTISQQILSRSNIEKIIDQFGLFENTSNMYLEDKINAMRRKIKVKIERARHGAQAFSISFTGGEPQRVMRIANTLASYFMDENLKVREAQAVGTSEFLESELEKTRKRLEEREQKLAAYRAKYLGGLPDELETNLRTLDRLQQQLASKNEIVREARNSLRIIEAQIVQSKQLAEAMNSRENNNQLPAALANGPVLSKNEQKLEAAEAAYENILLKYTKKHPDVLKLEKTIDKLKKNIDEEKAEAKEIPSIDNGQADSNTQQIPIYPNQAENSLKIKLIKDEIKKAQSEITDIESRMKIYQKRVEDTPKRELELQSLKRDYSNIQGVFNSLLDRKLEAELSVNMEKKQKGEQFRILDHARLPEKPITPNVKMLFLLSIAGGLGLGGGIIFLKEIINFNVIRRDKQIEEGLGMNILASIPPLTKSSARIKHRLLNVVFVGCCFYAMMFLGFFAVLNAKGLDRTVNFIKTYINV